MKCYGRPPAITFPLHRLTLHLYGSIPRDGIPFLFHDPSGDGFYETFGDSPRKIWLRSSLPSFKGSSFIDDLRYFKVSETLCLTKYLSKYLLLCVGVVQESSCEMQTAIATATTADFAFKRIAEIESEPK